LGGTITMRPGRSEDFHDADMAVPGRGTGTVVDLSVPLVTP